jgi:hypothetical protein
MKIGIPAAQDEELTITMSKQSASTRAYTAAGGEQARASDTCLAAEASGNIRSPAPFTARCVSWFKTAACAPHSGICTQPPLLPFS